MKRKSLLLIALVLTLCLSVVGIVACKPGESVDPDKQSIEITNVAALTAKWNVGEADRTVEVALSDGLKGKTVTLTAEPEGIVTIDGMKLTAAKNGTASVKATVKLDEEHEYTDSVEIKVDYNYSLTISNKSDLVKAFRLNTEDREVKVTLSDAIKNNKVEIKSSNTDAVTVVNGKLHALAKGESTITASTTLNGVTFKDSFKVTVWGSFDMQVTNKAALEGVLGKADEPRAIEVNLVEAGDYTLSDVTAISANTQVVKVEDMKIVPVGTGKTTVTVACGEGTDRKEVVINITVEVTPVLTIGEFDKTLERYVGESFELPEILVATDSSENDVKASVTVTCDNAELKINAQDKRTASADQIGRYTVTYKFTDPSKGDKIVEITFDVVEKIFDEVVTYKAGTQTDGKLSTKLAGEEGSLIPTTTANTNDIFVGSFNGVAPSQFYYAEATFAIPEVGLSNDVRVALGHYLADETYVLTSTMITYSGDFINIDVDLSKTDNLTKGQAVTNNQTCMYVYKVLNSKHIAKLAGDVTDETYSTSFIKISIARDGDYFYTFINDQYVQCVTLQNLRGKDTVPALVGKYFVNGNTSVTNIAYSADEATVRAKLYTADGLLGEHKEKMFVPFIDSNDSATGSHSQSYGDNVRIDTSLTSEANGLAFKYENGINPTIGASNNQAGAAVSPYIYFDGNFTYSWEAKLTGIKALRTDPQATNADDYRSILELKTNSIGYDLVQLGVGPGKNQTTGGSFKMSVKGYTSARNTDGWRKYCEPSTNDYGATGLNTLTVGESGTKVRFSLTRILHDDHAEYIMTATVVGDEAKTYTRIVNIGGSETSVTAGNYTTAHSQWKDPVIAYWRNSGVSGEFTNINWSLLPNDISAEFVTDGTDALTLQSKTEKRATNETGSEFEEVTSDMLVLGDSIYNKDIVIDLGENSSLEAGKYTVKLVANGDKKIDFGTNKYNRYDIELSEVYTATVTITENGRHLKLSGLTLGHGTYNVSFTKVTAPETPTEPAE